MELRGSTLNLSLYDTAFVIFTTMATSGFQHGPLNSLCEKCDSANGTTISLPIVAKQQRQLCESCLNSESVLDIDQTSSATWVCPKHPKQSVDFFCNSCDIAICQRCAFTDHRSEKHDVVDIDKVVEGKRASYMEQLNQVTSKVQAMGLLEETMEQEITNMEDHFRDIQRDIKAATAEEISRSGEEREIKKQGIQNRYDEELKRLRKQFQDEIDLVDQEADVAAREIDLRSGIVVTELSEVNDRFYVAMLTRCTQLKECMSGLRSMQKQLQETLALDSRVIVQCSKKLKQQEYVTDKRTYGGDSAKFVSQSARRVRFVRRHENRMIGQLVGLNRSWELKQRIKIPECVKEPLFITSIDDDLMAVLDHDTSKLYVISLTSQSTRLFISDSTKGTDRMLWDCAPLDRNTVVCGHYNSDCVSLYSIDGKLTTTIPVPAGFYGFVSVTKEGLILSSTDDGGLPTIHFVDPAEKTLLGSMTLKGKTICGIQTAPSGHVVVRTGNAEFTVVDRTTGTERTVHDPDWIGAECGVDRSRNRLFVAHWKKGSTLINVTITALDGQVDEKDIVSFEISSRSNYLSRCAITSTGSLVVSDGDHLLEYRRMVDFRHLENSLNQDVSKATEST